MRRRHPGEPTLRYSARTRTAAPSYRSSPGACGQTAFSAPRRMDRRRVDADELAIPPFSASRDECDSHESLRLIQLDESIRRHVNGVRRLSRVVKIRPPLRRLRTARSRDTEGIHACRTRSTGRRHASCRAGVSYHIAVPPSATPRRIPSTSARQSVIRSRGWRRRTARHKVLERGLGLSAPVGPAIVRHARLRRRRHVQQSIAAARASRSVLPADNTDR